MSAVIAEPKLEGQTVPFSHTTPMGYNLIKIQPHSTASAYAVQVVFTVHQPLSASLGTPPLLCAYLHQCPPACLSHRLHVCWHTWATGLRFMSCARLLICNLCHTSPAFSPAMLTVSFITWLPSVSILEHEKKQTKPSTIAHFSNNNSLIPLNICYCWHTRWKFPTKCNATLKMTRGIKKQILTNLQSSSSSSLKCE